MSSLESGLRESKFGPLGLSPLILPILAILCPTTSAEVIYHHKYDRKWVVGGKNDDGAEKRRRRMEVITSLLKLLIDRFDNRS